MDLWKRLVGLPGTESSTPMPALVAGDAKAGASGVFGGLRRQDGGMPLSLPIEPEATKLLHDSPLALILAMLLDQ